jgi:hypothetical protein
MTSNANMLCAGDRDDQSRRASRHVTRFGAATLLATSAARGVVVTTACSGRRSDVLVPGLRPAQRQRVRTGVCVNTPAQSDYRGATAGVFTHAAVRASWS